MARQTEMSRKPKKKQRKKKKGTKLKNSQNHYKKTVVKGKFGKAAKNSLKQVPRSRSSMTKSELDSNGSRRVMSDLASGSRTSQNSCETCAECTKSPTPKSEAPSTGWSPQVGQSHDSRPHTLSKEFQTLRKTFSQKAAEQDLLKTKKRKKKAPKKKKEPPPPKPVKSPNCFRYKSPVSAKASMAAWYREADYKRRKTNAHNEREKARGRLNPPVPINLKPVQPKGLLTCKKNGLTSPKVGKSQPKFGKSNPKSKSLPFITKIKTALQKQQSSHPKNRENNYRKITSGGTEATGSLASGDKKAQHNKNNCQVRSFVISKNYQHEQANTTQQRANGQQPRTKLKPYGRVFFKPTLVKPAPNQRDHPLLRRNLHKFKEYLADRKNKSNCPSKVRRTLAKWDCINCPRSKDKQKQQRQQKQQKQQPQFQEAPPQPAQPQRSPTLNPTPICSSQANSPQSQNTRSRSPQSLQSPVQSPQLPTKRPQSQQTWSPIQLQSKSPTRCQSPGSKTTQSKHSQPQSPQSSKRQPDGSQSKNSQRLSASKGYQLRILTMQQRRERQAKNDEEREARKRIREEKELEKRRRIEQEVADYLNTMRKAKEDRGKRKPQKKKSSQKSYSQKTCSKTKSKTKTETKTEA